VVDLWVEEPKLTAMLEHPVDLLLPGGQGMENRADGNADSRTGLWPIALQARRSGDPQVQYAWEALGGRRGISADSVGENALEPLPFHLLFDVEEASSTAPSPSTRTRDKAPGVYGESLLRSGWGPDEAFLALQSGGRHPGAFIHQHDDAGHFSFYALGEAFSIETGYGDAHARHHSVFMPWGREPSPIHEPGQNRWVGGHNHAFGSTPMGGYAAVDTAWLWGCFYAYRHALMIRFPGTAPYTILLDNVSAPSDCNAYDWTVNTGIGNRIEAEGEARAVIHGLENRLELGWAMPAPEGLAVPPRLSLSQDRIDSDFIHEGRTLGLGTRPRLKARLESPCGMLLSALVPRRAEEGPAGIESMSTGAVLALTIDHGEVIDTVVAAPSDGRLRMEGVAGEGTLAVIRRSADREVRHALLVDGYALTVDGKPLLARRGEVQALREWNHDRGGECTE
jgi:hypothetical protein